MSLLSIWKKPSRQPSFWDWFNANQQHYVALQDNADIEHLINQANDQLRKVDPRLCCEFSTDDALAELVISANGDKSAFIIVEELVANAPKIPQWKISAFRQRGSMECAISMGYIDLGPEQIWFRLEGAGDKVGIHLYFAGIGLSNELPGSAAVLFDAALVLLGNAVGEYDLQTKVGFMEPHPLKPEDDVSQLKPFEKLPEAFDAFYAMTQK